jgi:F-type H+-transporting ATPase subunit b
MPQLDFSSYPPQLIWLAITFIALYFLMSRIALPRIGTVIEQRRDRVASDLDDAQRLKAESEEVMHAYEAELAEARAKAHAIAAEAREELNKELDAERSAVEAKIAEKLAEAEQKIAEVKAAAMQQVNDAAADTATSIVKALIGGRVTKAETTAAVKAVRG